VVATEAAVGVEMAMLMKTIVTIVETLKRLVGDKIGRGVGGYQAMVKVQSEQSLTKTDSQHGPAGKEGEYDLRSHRGNRRCRSGTEDELKKWGRCVLDKSWDFKPMKSLLPLQLST
jgi:hypothetical protein